ncbi:MAG TPA: DUF4838 domain-containing protein [Planctomycetota bacterium]|nr:DUF4838 domain-containing protein [Planctomycetota bacterium]
MLRHLHSFAVLLACLVVHAAAAEDLIIADAGKTDATIVVSAQAGEWEKRAAADLALYIERMSGAKPAVGNAPGNGTSILIGTAALEAEPALKTALAGVAKKNPSIRADAIVMRRSGKRVFLAGTNDDSHYFAVAQLLQDWGCRWYLPTDFGECIPQQARLAIGTLDRAYAPPFEIRHYWLSWNGDGTGAKEFRRRNFMTETSMAGMGHALGEYTKALIPAGKSMFNVAFAEEATAKEVAKHIDDKYAKGSDISLAIEDGNYVSDSPKDKEMQAGIWDKYAIQPSNTDAMMSLYNNVAKILRAKYPDSKAKIGGMAYANVTIPPQRVLNIEPNIYMWLAPIDIDPNHHMDDPKSPPRNEYREMLYRWAQLMNGRLAIYDYDQSQLVWRDLPNPTHYVFAKEVKHYQKAGILGIGTESRGAMATTFLNLFFRGQLMWNPDADMKALLTEFYPKFYGPAAAPMNEYWSLIYSAWENTISTEHEYFLAPEIYKPEVVRKLKEHLTAAQKAIEPLRAKADATRNEKLFVDRMRFTELSFEIIESYMALVQAGASNADYAAAVAAGEKGLAAREKLTAMSGIFTTYKNIGEHGAAWWPGEVQQMKDLAARTGGPKGTLIAKTPLEWAFRRDPHDTGLPRGWGYKEADLTFWNATGKSMTAEARKDYPDQWEMLRTDLYFQAQGVLHSDWQSYTGHYWYQTAVELNAQQTEGAVHILFPGLFNECWLYVNGEMIAHRVFPEPWWRNDYKFEWDVKLAGKLKAGKNTITLRGYNPHHFGGMFRRPVLYRSATP